LSGGVSPAPLAPSVGESAPDRTADAVAVGEELGPYRVLRKLGVGGMGSVHLAEVIGPARALTRGQCVALKIVHPHLLDTPEFLQRFVREGEIGMAVRHPNVVRTIQVEALPRGRNQAHLLVMEYVEGQTLRSLLDELERVPERLCRHIGREVAKGLAAIHASGIVHRDLKPENILITHDEVVKVMDLGVARLQQAALRLSRTGAFLGSIQYAAPEQFDGSWEDVDGRTDLHALGLVLYELVTGEHPFSDADIPTVMHRTLTEVPRRAGEINTQLSPFLEDVLHTLLAKKREERFPSAAELVTVLEEEERGVWWRGRTHSIRLEKLRPPRRIRIPRETAVYGREPEMAQLRSAFALAKKREGQVVLIEGEAGIGKTRLIDELSSSLRHEGEDLSFLFGSYPPGGAATAAGAFTIAVRDHLGESALQEALERHLTVTPLLVPAFAAMLRGDAPPPGAEPLTKDSLQTVFVHVTRSLAAERPVILLIDDLHFAPDEGRALFAALALAVTGHRVLLIGTMRPGISQDWIASIGRFGHASRLSLTRLSAAHVSELLIEAFRDERLVSELAPEIATRSDGNPFFVFEIIRELKLKEFVRPQVDGTWARARPIRDFPIPFSVLDLVQARIAHLDEEDRSLVDMACCCGFDFDPILVADALGMGAIPALKRFARIEKEHRLVRSAGRSYVFDHHQVQEVLYSGIFPQLRESYHANLGKALEARERAAEKEPKDLDGGVAVDLLRHFLQGAQGAQVLRYLKPALDHLERNYQNAAAVELMDRALAGDGLLTTPARIQLLLRKASLLGFLGRREEERATLDQALGLAEAAGDTAAQWRVRRSLGGYLTETSHYEQALAILTQALDHARSTGDHQAEMAMTGHLGNTFVALGRYEEARVHQELCLERAREVGDRDWEAKAIGNLGNVLRHLGRHEEARSHHLRNLTLAREIGDRRGEAIATGNLGIALLMLGELEEARSNFEQHLAVASSIGDRRSEVFATSNLGNVVDQLGHWKAALALHQRNLALAREIDYGRGEAIALGNLGLLYIALGDSARAREELTTLRTLCIAIRARALEGYALHGLGLVEEQEGAAGAAEDLYLQALDLRREIGYRSGIAETLVALGGMFAGLGRTPEAQARLSEALAIAHEIGVAVPMVLAAAQLALLPHGEPRMATEIFAAKEILLGPRDKMHVRHLLWRVTGDRLHLSEAHRLLTELRHHAPAAYRETMSKRVPLYREIGADWRGLVGSGSDP
jgi:serine/threonine protein kinase/tetratricopeptide (TPR) repeat protein